MAKLKYSYQGKKENTVRTLGKGINISFKEAYEVANAIRGLNIKKAEALLQDVLAKKRAIPYKRYNRGIGHKGNVGPGRYPLSSSSAFLELLDELKANAEYKGMNKDNLLLIHVATHNGGVSSGYYKGMPHNTPITHIELVAKETKVGENNGSRKKIHK